MPPGSRLTITIAAIAAVMPPLILAARRRKWRISLQQMLFAVTVLAAACWWAREDLRMFYPKLLHPRMIINETWIWPFIASWILTAAVCGPRKPESSRLSVERASRGRSRQRQRLLPWENVAPVIAYVIIHNIWYICFAPFFLPFLIQSGVWSEPNETGIPLWVFEHGVNAL
jgi:hypothetical protein